MTLTPGTVMTFTRTSPPARGFAGIEVSITFRADEVNNQADPRQVESAVARLVGLVASEMSVWFHAAENWERERNEPRGNT